MPARERAGTNMALPPQGSGRPWKEPATRASLVRNPLLATSWAKKMADKAQATAFKEARRASVDARREKLQVHVPAARLSLHACRRPELTGKVFPLACTATSSY